MGFWTFDLSGILSAIVLAVTLYYVIRYTKATKAMADATRSMAEANKAMADLQRHELELKRRPIIQVQCRDSNVFRFPIVITNLSHLHAKAKFRVSVHVDGNKLRMKDDNPYTGELIWSLQAGLSIKGDLDIRKLLSQNNLPDPAESAVQAEVICECWVINYHGDESWLEQPEFKNPIVRWYWNNQKREWAVDVAPRGIAL